MTLFQIVMLIATAFFAFKIYEHIQNMQDPDEGGEPNGTASDAATLVELADDAYEVGQYARAKALLAEADVMAPDTPEILNKLAFVLAKEGDRERALEHYERSLQIDAADDLVHNAMASIYREQGDFEKAREHFLEALRIDPEYEVTYFNYANLLTETGEHDEAKNMYEKALELKPDFMQAKSELEKLR